MGVYNVFSNQFGISGLLDTWSATDDMYGAFLRLLLVVFLRFKTSLHLLQLFTENAATPFCCEAPEMFLQTTKTSPDLPSACG